MKTKWVTVTIVRRKVNNLEKTSTHVVEFRLKITSEDMNGEPIESAALFKELFEEHLKEHFACDVEISVMEMYTKTW